jgi:prevent-host-death family protein
MPATPEPAAATANAAANAADAARRIALQMLQERGHGAVLVGVARVDGALEHLLQAVLLPTAGRNDSLFQADRPLGSFGARQPGPPPRADRKPSRESPPYPAANPQCLRPLQRFRLPGRSRLWRPPGPGLPGGTPQSVLNAPGIGALQSRCCRGATRGSTLAGYILLITILVALLEAAAQLSHWIETGRGWSGRPRMAWCGGSAPAASCQLVDDSGESPRRRGLPLRRSLIDQPDGALDLTCGWRRPPRPEAKVVTFAHLSMEDVVTAQVSVRDLKTHLSEWLGRVQAGEVVEVTSHRKPIARITAVLATAPTASNPLQRAMDAGVISWNGQNPVLPPPVKLGDGGPLISDIVIEDRGKGS